MKMFFSLSEAERTKLMHEALEKHEPIMALWLDFEPEFGDAWRNRAMSGAEWLADARSVADLGCGSMTLEDCLRPDQIYIPVDLLQRDARTLVLDLNKRSGLERLPNADACAMLGLLEYCYVPDELVAELRLRYKQVVTTFSVLDDQPPERRLVEYGWVNHFTRAELAALFLRHGFTMAREKHFQGRQYMFDFR